MKNSGGCSRRDTDHVFDFLRRDVEVVGDVGEAIAGDESVNEVLDACAAVDNEREAKGDRSDRPPPPRAGRRAGEPV